MDGGWEGRRSGKEVGTNKICDGWKGGAPNNGISLVVWDALSFSSFSVRDDIQKAELDVPYLYLSLSSLSLRAHLKGVGNLASPSSVVVSLLMFVA